MTDDAPAAILSVAASPHIRGDETIPRIMWSVVLALGPIGLWSLYLFGWYAGVVILTSVASAVFFEAAWQLVSRKPVTVSDGSAVVTGTLLAYVMPPNCPIYVIVVSAAVAMLIAKHLFGGLGCNIWNPALVGRAFAQIAYPAAVTLSTWPVVRGEGWARLAMDVRNAGPAGSAGTAGGYDAVSQATPLAYEALRTIAPTTGAAREMYPHLADLFFGTTPGCIGETSALLILLGGLYLISRGYVNWRVPAVFLGTLLVFSFVVPCARIPGSHAFGGLFAPAAGYGAPGGAVGGAAAAVARPAWWFVPLYEVLSGGAMLGAFFMATDMVTTPMTSRGQVIFALGCGIITGAVRLLGQGFPEGVCYSILLMNTAVPVIDRHTRQKKYGAAARPKAVRP